MRLLYGVCVGVGWYNDEVLLEGCSLGVVDGTEKVVWRAMASVG